MKKIILCYGDSWTAGHFVDPNLEEFTHILQDSNKKYCHERAWPHHLQFYTGVKTINYGEPACSNDRIIGKINETLPNILEMYRPEEILAIVGWSSPERKDFYFKTKKLQHWTTIRPAELSTSWHLERFKKEYGEFIGELLHKFQKIYVTYFWNPEEYVTRHRKNSIIVDTVFKTFGIDSFFFNAFYEKDNFVSEKDRIDDFRFAQGGVLGELYSSYEKNSLGYTFREYIEKNTNSYFENDNDYHPNEAGHRAWAEHLAIVLNDTKKI